MSKTIPFRTAYGTRDRSECVYTDDTPSMTMQSFQNECDINVIMRRWEKTGDLTHVRHSQGRYDDFADIGDYQSALNTVLAAQEAFEALPSRIRTRFSNDPASFVSFMQDPTNSNEIIAMGLATRPVLDESLPLRAEPTYEDQMILKTASKSVSDP